LGHSRNVNRVNREADKPVQLEAVAQPLDNGTR
jgi:hypothetical protein